MTPTDKPSHGTEGWRVSYTQSDVDTIREQIVQDQAAKRRFLLMVLAVTAAALAGAVVLLSTSYALYAGSESDKQELVNENNSLKSRLGDCQQQLDAKNAQEASQAQSRAQAQSRLTTLIPAVLGDSASGGDVARFAQMVYNLPQGRIELDRKPPDKLFRNWRVSTDSATEVYTLVGGFVDGKWVVYSNMVARR
ncbi:MAG: hypothetical protein L0229_14215 [Blastocatellia bacterium]|nr:hypothetical protein [Blastocatellia bacterium]